MKPSSLLGITLELVRELERPGPYPADARVGRFFRARRFLGSRDRRFLGETVYAWLRASLGARLRWNAWAQGRGLELPPLAAPLEESNPEERRVLRKEELGPLLLDLVVIAMDGGLPWSRDELAAAVTELAIDGLGPWHGAVESALADSTVATVYPTDPLDRLCAETRLPPWITRRLRDEMGEDEARRFAAALQEPGSVDLRVQIRRVPRERVRKSLVKDTGLEVEPTHYSPLGLRLGGRANLTSTQASRKNWIEVQDEGSQLAVLSTDASEGMRIIDACAGGGGKTLALADIVFRDAEIDSTIPRPEKGRILACDVDRRRLDELRRRAREASAQEYIDYALVSPEGDLTPHVDPAHLVVVDAPCTGVGTLRRNPELKLRYDDEDVARFAALQLSILERFSALVRPRGRLVYITCSFLREECEGVVEAFEARHPEFESSPSYFASTRLPTECISGHKIRLSPLTTRTDAFFIASWKRRRAAGDPTDSEDVSLDTPTAGESVTRDREDVDAGR